MNMIESNQTALAARLILFSSLMVLSVVSQSVSAAGFDSGRKLYLAHCAGCHGVNGISVMPQASNFSRAKLLALPDQDLIDIIRSGRNMMPAYLGILNDHEILDVINYLRVLQ